MNKAEKRETKQGGGEEAAEVRFYRDPCLVAALQINRVAATIALETEFTFHLPGKEPD